MDAATPTPAPEALYRRDPPYTQQDKQDRNGGKKNRNRRGHKGRQEENGFHLCRCMTMVPLERMRMHDDNTVHHVRVSEQGDSSQVCDKQKRKKPFQYVPQLLQKHLFNDRFAKVCLLILRSNRTPDVLSNRSPKYLYIMRCREIISKNRSFNEKNIVSLQLYDNHATSNT